MQILPIISLLTVLYLIFNSPETYIFQSRLGWLNSVGFYIFLPLIALPAITYAFEIQDKFIKFFVNIFLNFLSALPLGLFYKVAQLEMQVKDFVDIKMGLIKIIRVWNYDEKLTFADAYLKAQQIPIGVTDKKALVIKASSMEDLKNSLDKFIEIKQKQTNFWNFFEGIADFIYSHPALISGAIAMGTALAGYYYYTSQTPLQVASEIAEKVVKTSVQPTIEAAKDQALISQQLNTTMQHMQQVDQALNFRMDQLQNAIEPAYRSIVLPMVDLGFDKEDLRILKGFCKKFIEERAALAAEKGIPLPNVKK